MPGSNIIIRAFGLVGLCYIAMAASCNDTPVVAQKGAPAKEVQQPAPVPAPTPRPRTPDETTRYNVEHLRGKWQMDSLNVGPIWLSAKIIEGELTLRFTDDNQMIANTLNTKSVSRYEVRGNEVTCIPLDQNGEMSVMTIEFLDDLRLVLRMISQGENSRMILIRKP